MYSISFEKNLVEGLSLISPKMIHPHEKVIDEKTSLLINYLNTFNESIVVSSILCCSKSMVIIDGHHRFFALKKLGFKKIPVTKLDYFSNQIKTGLNFVFFIIGNEVIEEVKEVKKEKNIYEIAKEEAIKIGRLEPEIKEKIQEIGPDGKVIKPSLSYVDIGGMGNNSNKSFWSYFKFKFFIYYFFGRNSII